MNTMRDYEIIASGKVAEIENFGEFFAAQKALEIAKDSILGPHLRWAKGRLLETKSIYESTGLSPLSGESFWENDISEFCEFVPICKDAHVGYLHDRRGLDRRGDRRGNRFPARLIGTEETITRKVKSAFFRAPQVENVRTVTTYTVLLPA